MPDTAQEQIKAFIDRIIRLRGEVAALNLDIREIYAEAKAFGLDKTILGKAVLKVEKTQADPQKVAEADMVLEVYLEAYYGVGTNIALAHTHERNAA